MEHLLDALGRIERKYRDPDQSGAPERVSTGWPAVDAALGGGLCADGLHEWFGVAEREADRHVGAGRPRPAGGTSGAGEAPAEPRPTQAFVSTANPRRREWSPPLGIVTHVVRTASRGSPLRLVWIGRSCFPDPHLLAENDHDEDSPRVAAAPPLARSLFVAVDEPALRLWAMELALRSPAVGLVAGDGSRLRMPATRRLALLARTHRKPVLLMRPAWELCELSAANSRWRVRWAPDRGVRAFGPHEAWNVAALHAAPCWSLELLRCRGVLIEQGPRRWILELDRATNRIGVSAELERDAGAAPRRAPAADRPA